jgi:hypothetical protein
VNRLKQWGLKKNLKTSETAFAVAKGKQRARDEGKEAAFFFVEPEVRRERIEKYTRKFPISLTDPVSPRPCT